MTKSHELRFPLKLEHRTSYCWSEEDEEENGLRLSVFILIRFYHLKVGLRT